MAIAGVCVTLVDSGLFFSGVEMETGGTEGMKGVKDMEDTRGMKGTKEVKDVEGMKAGLFAGDVSKDTTLCEPDSGDSSRCESFVGVGR